MSEPLDQPDDFHEAPAVTVELTADEQLKLGEVAVWSPEILEREHDETLLKFARWLYEHGRINEG